MKKNIIFENYNHKNVPDPMTEILKKKGFKKHYEYSEEMDCKIEMWEKEK